LIKYISSPYKIQDISSLVPTKTMLKMHGPGTKSTLSLRTNKNRDENWTNCL